MNVEPLSPVPLTPIALSLFKMRQALLAIRDETDHDFSLLSVLILLYIASRPGCTAQDILMALDTPKATISRNLMYMLDHRREGQGKGYNFIDMVEDRSDRRRKEIFLTATGQKLVNKLAEIVT